MRRGHEIAWQVEGRQGPSPLSPPSLPQLPSPRVTGSPVPRCSRLEKATIPGIPQLPAEVNWPLGSLYVIKPLLHLRELPSRLQPLVSNSKTQILCFVIQHCETISCYFQSLYNLSSQLWSITSPAVHFQCLRKNTAFETSLRKPGRLRTIQGPCHTSRKFKVA